MGLTLRIKLIPLSARFMVVYLLDEGTLVLRDEGSGLRQDLRVFLMMNGFANSGGLVEENDTATTSHPCLNAENVTSLESDAKKRVQRYSTYLADPSSKRQRD